MPDTPMTILETLSRAARVLISDEGVVVAELANGASMRTTIPLEQVPQCRRLVASWRSRPDGERDRGREGNGSDSREPTGRQ